MRFTDRFIMNLKPEGKIVDIREGEGFGIRILPSGIKTFFFIYRIDGKRRFLNLGHYDPNAASGERGTLAFFRKEYTAAKKKVLDGVDPLGEQVVRELERKRTPTVAKFIEEYIDGHAKVKKRSWRTDEKVLKKDILPVWGPLKITDIKRRDIRPILDAMVKRGAPVQANRLLAYVRKMFSYAVSQDVIENNPFLRMDAPAIENSRERYLSAEEIRLFWKNLDSTDAADEIKRALRLILVTGQRPGEVMGLHRREIDGRWWTLPKERSKNKEANRIYLTDLALELIGDGKEYIFESPRKKWKKVGEEKDNASHPYDPLVATKSIKRNLTVPIIDDEGKQLFTDDGKPAFKNVLGIAPFTPHDLRRTVSTQMAEIGIDEQAIDRIQNHVTNRKRGVTHVYVRYTYDKEKQAAMEAWERKLKSIVSGKEARKVVSIATAKDKGKL
ncbi:MAG TPA: tyrosine-type recombinase/integrase [Geobacteraceae bacterium]|nr:tyrosine-type recombinase/integrase [Geobacteraceae bacterium]